MKRPLFIGSGVAIVTPFTKDGTDFKKLAELIEFQIANKTDAIIICGTTGEASTMPDSEHKAAIEFAVKTVNKRVPVIAGTGSNYTKHAIELSQYAETVGADGLLSVTPYYNKTSQKGLVEHFKAIAQSVTLPIILYNVPSRTNLNINPETLKELSKINNIIAVKECNLGQTPETAALCGDNLVIYSGEDGMIVPFLSLGAKGVISVMANIIPEDTHNIVMKYLHNDLAGSLALQLKATPLIKALFADVNPVPVKAAMNIMGMKVGSCRMPLIDMSMSNLDFLKKELKIYGLLK